MFSHLVVALTVLSVAVVAQVEEQCERPIDVVYVIDSSGSITAPGWQLVKQFFIDVTKRLKVTAPDSADGAHVAAVVYSQWARNEFELNTFSTGDEIIAKLSTMKWMGAQTNHQAAFKRARLIIEGPAARADAGKVVIHMTDGASTVKPELTEPRALELKNAGATLINIGVKSPDLNVEQLKLLASPNPQSTTDPKEKMFMFAEDFVSLQGILETISTLVCEVFTTTTVIPTEAPIPTEPPAPVITTPAPLEKCQMVADVLFLIDSSNSINENIYQNQVKGFFKSVVQFLGPSPQNEIRIGAIQFSFNTQLVSDLTNDKDALLAKLDAMNQLKSMTDMYKGFKRSWKTFERNPRDEAGKVVIMMTDGAPTGKNVKKTEWAAEELKARGYRLIIIGVGDDIDQKQCERMASKDPETGEAYFHTAVDFDQLTAKIEDIVGMTCDQPPEPIPDGNVCTGIIDVVVGIDNSGSIPDASFKDAPAFVKNLIRSLQIGPVRVGVFQWNSDVDVLWGLDDFTKCTKETSPFGFNQNFCPATIIYPETKAAMLDLVDERMAKKDGTTNGEEALRYVKRLFDDRKVRKNSKSIIIFLSDGFPNLYTEWNPKDPFFPLEFVYNETLAVEHTADAYEKIMNAYPESQFFGIGIGEVKQRWMRNLASPTGKTIGDQTEESLNSLRVTQIKDMAKWSVKDKLFFYGDKFADVNAALQGIIGRNCAQADPSFNVDDEDPNEVDPNAAS